MIDKIQEKKVKKILLLGTSEKMVIKLAEVLELPPISQMITIEEIASQKDIENAIKSRFEEGKHVIPVPAIEVKRDYAQILSDTIRIFSRRAKIRTGWGTIAVFREIGGAANVPGKGGGWFK